MAARVVDLEVLDIAGLAYFRFRWSGNRDEWHEALGQVKARIDPIWREYDEVTTRWRVSCAYQDVLAAIFPNFAGALDGIRSQGSLFE